MKTAFGKRLLAQVEADRILRRKAARKSRRINRKIKTSVQTNRSRGR